MVDHFFKTFLNFVFFFNEQNKYRAQNILINLPIQLLIKPNNYQEHYITNKEFNHTFSINLLKILYIKIKILRFNNFIFYPNIYLSVLSL